MVDRPSSITGDIFSKGSANTSLHAWEPWDFTRAILFELQNSDIDEEHWEWQIFWFAGVALLRTIGHVLAKVDAKRSERHAVVIGQAWQDWKSNPAAHWVFFEFVECERNNILKEFSFGAALPDAGDHRILTYGDTEEDAAQLFREAVYWWRDQLEMIEIQLS